MHDSSGNIQSVSDFKHSYLLTDHQSLERQMYLDTSDFQLLVALAAHSHLGRD